MDVKRFGLIAMILVASASLGAAEHGREAAGEDGLVRSRSPYGVEETLDRFEKAAAEKGLNVFARIDHAEAADRIGAELRPTALLIFGSPEIGTRLMQSRQTIGIDLPLKLLAWQDAEGRTWLAYPAPSLLVRRHGIRDREEVVAGMEKALAGLVAATTARS